jgi:hypothetical protein
MKKTKKTFTKDEIKEKGFKNSLKNNQFLKEISFGCKS